MLVLGIETSCDETAVACVDAQRRIRSHIIHSQLAAHAPYGGVVPEIAARAHLDRLQPMIGEAIGAAGAEPSDISAVAATVGPGLIGGLIVGATMAKAVAYGWGKPFVAVNHLEAHALSARLSDDVPFPFLLLLVSGGHCQLIEVEAVGRYSLYGQTIDDALGEAFDKTARILGLGYPGGPAVERLARQGDPGRFPLPRPMLGRPGCDFSFAGLKTAVRHAVQALPPGEAEDELAADLCASFQAACADVLADRARTAIARFREKHGHCEQLVVAGGVASNQFLRARLDAVATDEGARLIVPPVELCTDNGAMVAWAGLERFRLGERSRLDIAPRPRWPLASLTPPHAS